jgi:hypothetical protein
MPRPEPDRTSELTAPVIAFADEIGQFEFDFDSGLPGILVALERCRLPRIVAAGTDADVPMQTCQLLKRPKIGILRSRCTGCMKIYSRRRETCSEPIRFTVE